MQKYVEEYAKKPEETVLMSADSVRILEGRKKTSFLTLACWKAFFVDVFLPRGYPHSVSADYMSYQIWDTVQAFASSMTSALATEAVLRGAGVGDENASALAATLTWLIRDGLGMLSRIGFAWLKSAQLDADCKRWRLVADFLNDLAFSLELLAAALPSLFTLLVCLSSLARSIVAVAGGATRTTVVQHQARCNNVADVSAKDGSQETLVNVTALLCSLILLPLISGRTVLIWMFYILFTGVHLFANYAAVTALHFETLNQKLLRIITNHFVETGDVFSVKVANELEPLLFGCASRYYGCRLYDVLSAHCALTLQRDSFIVGCEPKLEYAYIAMASGTQQREHIKAAFYVEYALITGRFPSRKEEESFFECLRSRGWHTDLHRLAFDQWTYTAKE
uniref:Protein root UVB sensitive/RUS domain-containing protein n=1 Tax=Ascaris suum TaxID=6253 RepID=F1L6T6_ASCSU